MRLDHDEIANLRVAIDPAENPRFTSNARIAGNATVRPIHLRDILNPSVAVMGKRRFVFDVPADIAAPHIGEIAERPNSIDRPIARLQKIAGQQFVFLCHGRLL
jgi:hypothetical protein